MPQHQLALWTKRLFKVLLVFLAMNIAYVLICVAHGTFTEFDPPEEMGIVVKERSRFPQINTDELSFINWNVGYMGLGKESNFFYDDGRFFFSGDMMVRSPEQLVEKNLQGVVEYLKKETPDFILLQELDLHSKRSYYIDQYRRLVSKLEYEYCGAHAVNFDVYRVPIPVMEPWNVMGMMQSGIATLSRYRPDTAIRYQFPGEFSWPNRIFHLKRCMSLQRYNTKHPEGKELVVINTHNSAYDKGGTMKAQEMALIKQHALAEYEKGNYVVIGGDWNQCPPDISLYHFSAQGVPGSDGYEDEPIASDFMPSGWQWVYDKKTPTHRALNAAYEEGKTFTALIDFYLVSPNVELLEVETKNMGFDLSDHQPVHMRIRLKGLKDAARAAREAAAELSE